MTAQDQQRILKLLLQMEKKMQQLYGSTYSQVVELSTIRTAIESGNADFSFDTDKAALKQAEQLMNRLSKEVSALLKAGVQTSFEGGEASAMAMMVSGAGRSAEAQAQAKQICQQAIKKQRERGMNGRDYANATRGGFSLSERVWNLKENAYKEMEIIIQNGILEGQSAADISRGVRGHLNNPKALFRSVRVKDPETGEWTGEYKMSKAAKAYHPGQGVYRSAYQNALRMARTEVNQAYRTGEWSAGQGNPLIKGYEIKLSGNHTTRVKTKKGIVYKHLHDVCDDLAGVYPKNFRWGGWHPNCRCYMVAIQMTPQEMARYIKAQREGRGEQYARSVEVKELPQNFKDWLTTHAEAIEATPVKGQPYFLQDNQWVFNKQKTPLEIAEERHAARTPEQIADIKQRAAERQARLKANALTKTQAENVLKAAQGWSEVDYTALQSAVALQQSQRVYTTASIEGMKKAMQSVIDQIHQQQAAEKALADIIPDVHKWHQQFSIAELQKVKDGALKTLQDKANKNYVPDWNSLPLDKKKAILENEIKYVSDPMHLKPHKLYPTSPVMESVYQKELAAVNEAIAWQATEANLAAIKAYSVANPASGKIAALVAEAEAIKANGGSIVDVEAKIKAAETIKAKNEASKVSKAKQQAAKNAAKVQQLQADKQALEVQKAAINGQIAATTDKALLKQYKANIKTVQKQIDAVDKQIAKLGGGSPFSPDAYSQARKNAAVACYDDASEHAYFMPNADQWKAEQSAYTDTWKAMRDYTSNSTYYTRTARSLDGWLETEKPYAEKAIKHINLLTDKIAQSTFDRDVMLSREERAAFAALKIGGVDLLKYREQIEEYAKKARIKYKGKLSTKEIEDKIKAYQKWREDKLIGLSGTDPSASSTSAKLSYHFSGTGGDNKYGYPLVTLRIYCPKGTQAAYVAPYSSLGPHEHEVMLQGFSTFRVTGAKYDAIRDKWILDVDIIGQAPRKAKGLVWNPNNVDVKTGKKGGWEIVWE